MDVRITVKRIVFGWMLLIALVALLGKVSVAASDAGRTAADFLSIGAGARAAGLGGAYTAVSDGACASYWNPAGLTKMDGGEASFSHFSWYQDVILEYGAVAYQMSDITTIAASVTFLNYGTIAAYDIEGNETGEISAYDVSGGLSFGFRVNENMSVGFTGKFISQKLDDCSGSSFAADLGFLYNTRYVSLAAFVGNVGPEITFDKVTEKLPATSRLGIAVRPAGMVMVSADYEKKFYGGSILSQGLELNFRDQYFIRTGYAYYLDQDTRSFGSGITLGAGLKLGKAEFDYSYTPSDDYTSDDLHRLSLVFKFGH